MVLEAIRGPIAQEGLIPAEEYSGMAYAPIFLLWNTMREVRPW